jgi:hypothetical protein
MLDRCEDDTVAAHAGLDGKRGRKVTFANTGWADEQNCLVLSDELTRRERLDPHCVERSLEVEVEFLKRLHDRKACGTKSLVDTLVLSHCEFAVDETFEKVQITELLVDCRLVMRFDDGCGVTEAQFA